MMEETGVQEKITHLPQIVLKNCMDSLSQLMVFEGVKILALIMRWWRKQNSTEENHPPSTNCLTLDFPPSEI